MLGEYQLLTKSINWNKGAEKYSDMHLPNMLE